MQVAVRGCPPEQAGGGCCVNFQRFRVVRIGVHVTPQMAGSGYFRVWTRVQQAIAAFDPSSNLFEVLVFRL
jgi:hypothetical protein